MNASRLFSSLLRPRRIRTGRLLALGFTVVASAPSRVFAPSEPEPILKLAGWDRYRGPAFGAEPDDAVILGLRGWACVPS